MVTKKIEFLLWSDEFKTSNNLLDEQHKKFIRIINNLAEAIDKGCEKNIMEIFFEIIFYIDHYMIEKDMLLVGCNKKKYEIHKRLHLRLLDKVKSCYKKFSGSEDIKCCVRLHKFLREWFISYIKIIKEDDFNECWKY